MPGHVPSESRHGRKALGQRGGGWRLALSPHVPTESCRARLAGSICLCAERLNDLATPGRCFSEDGLCCLHDVAGFFQATFPQNNCCGRYLDWCGLFFIQCSGLQIGVGLCVPDSGANFVAMFCDGWGTLFDFKSCESQPFQLTGSCIFLHRQNVLSVGYAFMGKCLCTILPLCGNIFSVGPPALGFAMCVEDAPYHMVANETVGNVLCDLLTDARSTCCIGGADYRLEVAGTICRLLDSIQYCLDFLLQGIFQWIWMGLLHLGQWWQQAFTFLVATVGFHLCQLLLYAIRLKGGKCNADNILRCSRQLCSGCPLSMAIELNNFSPRLSRPQRQRRMGFSRDLWLLLLLLCALCPGVSAGAGTQYSVDSTGFRAERRSRRLASAVYNRRSACRNPGSPDSPDEPPGGQPPEGPPSDEDDTWDFATDSYLFQLFAFGCLPSHMVCAFLQGTSMQEAIDQISVDAHVPVDEESGIFFPAKGAPLRDAFVLLWVPDWLTASYNHLLFVDATMLGKYAFVMQYQGFAISYADIAEQLAPFWEEEVGHIYIFAPYFSLDPMQQDTRFPASNGLTVVLQRDAFALACIPDPVEAFRQYQIWGMDVEDADQPPADLQWPVDKVQMTIGSETRLYSIGQLDPTPLVLSGLARRFVPGAGTMQVILANSVPERHVWFGEPVSQMSAVSDTLTPPDMICVFLVMRGIGRECRAAWLKPSDFTRTRILDALHLDIAFIPGFRVSITGGTKERGRIVCRHGDVLFLNFVHNDDYESS